MANKINRTDLYPNTTPADDDFVLGTDVSNTTNDANGEVVTFTIDAIRGPLQRKPSEGAFVDGDKTKLDGIEAGADVTDTANVTAAGALMDSEVTNLAAVKAFDPADYATAAQGGTADTAIQPGDDADTLGSGAATSGQILTADGAGGASWSDLAAGFIPVAKHTVSSPVAALEFTLPSGYSAFFLRLAKMQPSTDGVHLYLRTSADGGTTFDASADYDYFGDASRGVQVAQDFHAAAANEIAITGVHAIGNASGEEGPTGTVQLESVGAGQKTRLQSQVIYTSSTGEHAWSDVRAATVATSVTDAIQLIFSSGNIASGVVHVYGVLDGDA